MEIYAIILTLTLSAWFAGAETVFLSFNKVRMPVWQRQGVRGAKWLAFLISKPERFLVTTLTGNTIANVIYSSVVAVWLATLGFSERVILIAAPVVLLICGEVVPKALARQLADRIVLQTAIGLAAFRFLLRPVGILLEAFANLLRDRLGVSANATQRVLSRADIAAAVFESGREGAFSTESALKTRRVLGIARKRVSAIMTPRVSITAVQINSTIDEVRRTVLSSGHSHLPCYGDNADDIRGMVSALDLLKKPGTLMEILRPLPMVPESLSSGRLLRWFKDNETRIAGVIDEFGGFAGLVTHEDLVEELIGPIEDEYDREGHGCFRISGCEWLVRGEVRLSHLEQATGVNIASIRARSVGGYLTQLANGIPNTGDDFTAAGGTFRVIRADSRGVKLIRLTTHDRKE